MDGTDIEGYQLELVDRFMTAIDEAPDSDPQSWLRAGIIVSAALGCTGALSPPRERARGMAGIRARLTSLVDAGLDEEFLVRGLRDLLESRLHNLADIETSNERLEPMREVLRRTITEPETLRQENSALAHLSDQRVREIAKRQLDDLGDRIEADDAAKRWQLYENWRAARGQWLRDEDLNQWARRQDVHLDD